MKFLADRTRFLWSGKGTVATGRKGEKLAARLMKKAGYRILGRNVRVPMGEADLVCLAPDRQTIVIVEVKTRTQHPTASATIAPHANVHAHKRRKLRAIARWLIRKNHWQDRPVRIDVVSVQLFAKSAAKPQLEHLIGAVIDDNY